MRALRCLNKVPEGFGHVSETVRTGAGSWCQWARRRWTGVRVPTPGGRAKCKLSRVPLWGGGVPTRAVFGTRLRPIVKLSRAPLRGTRGVRGHARWARRPGH